jgi:hypothetical protein
VAVGGRGVAVGGCASVGGGVSFLSSSRSPSSSTLACATGKVKLEVTAHTSDAPTTTAQVASLRRLRSTCGVRESTDGDVLIRLP